MEWLLIF